VLDKVLAAVENKKLLYTQKNWTFRRRNGEVVVLREVFERVAKWIFKFKDAIDVAIQADPVHAALPWAGIRILLQASFHGLIHAANRRD
jgi:hypothetical protein